MYPPFAIRAGGSLGSKFIADSFTICYSQTPQIFKIVSFFIQPWYLALILWFILMHGIDILIEFYIQWDKKVNLKKIGRSFQLPKSNDKTPKNCMFIP